MKKLNIMGISGHMCGFNPLPPLFAPGPAMLPNISGLQQPPAMLHQPHLPPTMFAGPIKSCPAPIPMMARAGRSTPPTTEYALPVSTAASDAHIRGLMTGPKLSPSPTISSTSQVGMLEELFQDSGIAASPPLSASSIHSIDIPTSVPSSSAQVSHLEPSITEVMSFPFSSDPSGPVSPEEMSQYLNETCRPVLPMAPTQEYAPDSSSAFVTDPLLACHSQHPNNA